jgi:hypothetical protein
MNTILARRYARALLALLLGGVATPSIAQALVDDFTNVSGVWIDADRAAQGVMIEQLDAPRIDGTPVRVGVSWFTWAPAADAAPGPRWLFGVGLRDGDTIIVDPLMIALRGRFPGDLAAPAAELQVWGRLEIVIEAAGSSADHRASLNYQGPPGWGSGERDYRRLTNANSGLDFGLIFDPPIWPYSRFAAGGTYSHAPTPGQGWILNNYPRDDASVEDGSGFRTEAALIWYTYDALGAPTWLFGLDDDLWGPGLPRFALQQAKRGGTFEGGTPVLEAWGTAIVRGPGGPPQGINCGFISQVRWEPTVGAIGEVSVGRITRTYDHHVPQPDFCFSR